jgi:hypothetical protein
MYNVAYAVVGPTYDVVGPTYDVVGQDVRHRTSGILTPWMYSLILVRTEYILGLYNQYSQ